MGSRKSKYKDIDGTPHKRVFLSIINDYNLITGLCELIDNAIDMWTNSGRQRKLEVKVELDARRQLISVMDNAGGVKEANIEYLVSPGASGLASGTETIGTFGVGGKRAGVALGELVEIKSRYKEGKTLQIDISKDWLESEDWEVTVFEIPNITKGSTIVEISKLRQGFNEEAIAVIRSHLSETYANFLKKGCEIYLNDETLPEKHFNHWAYPPAYPPRRLDFDVSITKGDALHVTMTGGLIRDRDPEEENYGVYIYCNDRLIVKELRTRDVGYFITSEAGVPHPDASLCRVVVEINGAPAFMPWNSSKNEINFSHPAFLELRPSLIDLVSFYTKLSRRFKFDWQEHVFRHSDGDIDDLDTTDIKATGRLVLPQLPRVRQRPLIERLKDNNRKLIHSQPWTLGLIEALGMVDVISRQKLDTKNRAALILLDSNLEIALKEFIVSRDDLFPKKQYPDAKIRHLFQSRSTVINEVREHIDFSNEQIAKINHYYELRNKLIHERATVGITDPQVRDYRTLVEQILKKLFGAKLNC